MSAGEVNEQVNNTNTSPVPNNPVSDSTSQGEQKPARKKAITGALVVFVGIVVLAALLIAVRTLGTDQTTPPPSAPAAQKVEIKGEKDLKVLEDELRGLNFSDLEQDLNANAADAAKF